MPDEIEPRTIEASAKVAFESVHPCNSSAKRPAPPVGSGGASNIGQDQANLTALQARGSGETTDTGRNEPKTERR